MSNDLVPEEGKQEYTRLLDDSALHFTRTSSDHSRRKGANHCTGARTPGESNIHIYFHAS